MRGQRGITLLERLCIAAPMSANYVIVFLTRSDCYAEVYRGYFRLSMKQATLPAAASRRVFR